MQIPLPQHAAGQPYDEVQFTLVDCPGHASLMRTIIGGAQIIDMMLLVIDVTKGAAASAKAGTFQPCTDSSLISLNISAGRDPVISRQPVADRGVVLPCVHALGHAWCDRSAERVP